MKVVLDGTRFEADTVIACGGGLLEEQVDKVGSVRIFGAGGREALALVEHGRLLFREYPEECVRFSAPPCVVEDGQDRTAVPDAVLVLAKQAGATRLATRLDDAATRDALARLQRYATRLVRLDTP